MTAAIRAHPLWPTIQITTSTSHPFYPLITTSTKYYQDFLQYHCTLQRSKNNRSCLLTTASDEHVDCDHVTLGCHFDTWNNMDFMRIVLPLVCWLHKSNDGHHFYHSTCRKWISQHGDWQFIHHSTPNLPITVSRFKALGFSWSLVGLIVGRSSARSCTSH